MLKEAPTQVFSCEYCETFKNTCFTEHLRTPAAASGSSLENYTSNNTTQHETTRVQQDTTRDNTSATRHSTTRHECKTIQYE